MMKRKNLLVKSELERRWSDVSDDYFLTEYVMNKKYPALQIRHRYILSLLGETRGTVLDVGCGPGEMVIDLLRMGKTVHGVDISEKMLALAEKNIKEKGIYGEYYLKQGNIEHLNFGDETFDTVVCAGVIEYLDEDTKALKELHRVLKVNGTLILSVRNKTCPFRVLDPVVDGLKGGAPGRGLKRWITGKRGANGRVDRFIPYRKHVPGELDRLIGSMGFEKTDFRYFHFYPFIAQFDKLFPSVYINCGLRMERLSNTKLGWLGSGYIIKAVKA
jgi:ubiquinone/menaquinone biosynthesis C-methylase UbiE